MVHDEKSPPVEIEVAPRDAARAAGGAGASKTSPAASKTSTAGTIRRRIARLFLVVPADKVAVPSSRRQ